MEIITNSEEETLDWAAGFAKDLKGGEILALVGELGSGKTTFAKGLAQGLGINQSLSSPTFVYMKLYGVQSPNPGQENIKQLCHIDAYRTQHEYDIISIGAEDFIGKEDIITVIEWADKIKDILPQRTRFLYFTNKNATKRFITDNA